MRRGGLPGCWERAADPAVEVAKKFLVYARAFRRRCTVRSITDACVHHGNVDDMVLRSKRKKQQQQEKGGSQ